MSKNKRSEIKRIFGANSVPGVNSPMRAKQMKHIHDFIQGFFGLTNGKTPGKINASGKLIDKPNWEYGELTYEFNPNAAVHEIAHLCLADKGLSLKQIDSQMRQQYGYVMSTHGYQKQKRSVYEILPMGLEQKIRRVLGLPASMHGIDVNLNSPIRRCVEGNKPCAKRIKTKKGHKDLIRLSSNLDVYSINRFNAILEGRLVWTNSGWIESNSIDAKINRRVAG